MATTLPSRAIERSSASPAAAGRILLLVRDAISGNDLYPILERLNFSVLACSSIDEAVAVLASDPGIDLTVMDCGQDVDALLPSVQELGAAHAVPLVIMTPADQMPVALKALRLGAYDILVQPFSAEQGAATVARAIEYRRLRAQNDLYRHHLEQVITARTQMIQQTMQQLERSYDVTLEALGDALDLKDAETEGHSKRVTAYTLALGRAVGLSGPELRTVGRGAFLHDIGKMAIPDAILRKPGRLTREEQTIMRTHSELGYQMLRKIPFLHEAAEIVYAHQECYDGSGYPRGLRGEQIPMGARIFSLADTLDAITSNRPYRKANTIEAARKEVLRCAGSQFDPAIVDAFLATPDSIWQELREGIMREGKAFSPFSYTFGEVL